VIWIIVAKNHYHHAGIEEHITLLSAELIGKYCFDEEKQFLGSSGKNLWKVSGVGASAVRGLRPWLNSNGNKAKNGFYQAFSDTFKKAIIIIEVPNTECKVFSVQQELREADDLSEYSRCIRELRTNGDVHIYNTNDHVFVPSTTELGDTVHHKTYPTGTAYPFFQREDKAKKFARIAKLGESASWYWTRSPDISSNHYVRYVDSFGEFSDYGLANNSSGGVRPAVNLKADTLVSEIRK